MYHITMLKAAGVPDFGHLAGSCDIPVGSPGCSYIVDSPIGRAVKTTLYALPSIHSALRHLQYALMPDHLHILLSVESELDEHLGLKLARFKNRVKDLAGIKGIFAEGYNDQIITAQRDLNSIFRYIRENPYRLAVRYRHPEYFSRAMDITVAGRRYSAYGNLALLRNPFKDQVVVHRADTPARRAYNRDRWLYTAANGGVLVSPFISRDEREIRDMAERLDARIILISNEGYGERQKPTGHNFNQCACGRLLILTPIDPAMPADLTRSACLAMNAHAASIAAT